MTTARISASPRVRHLVDYVAFSLLFASVSIAVAVALGGIVLLLAPSGETATSIESSVSGNVQLSGNRPESQAPAQ